MSSLLITSVLLIHLFYQIDCVSKFEKEFWEVDNQKIWAILVAGSKGWVNYRHQANVCHAYHMLRAKGIPANQIITFMYDDIADNQWNPYPGKIFNDYTHTDYYNGMKIDYSYMDVNVDKFIQVLLGDKNLESSGQKVLKSNSGDNIFLYMTDHGNDGYFLFPDNSDVLTNLYFNETLTQMYNDGKYNKMLIYMEACYSGSMFYDILSPDINVMAVTSANQHENSMAVFCRDPEVHACLAGGFSYNWISDSESNDITRRTVAEQFRTVKSSVSQSHVEEFGYVNLGSLELSYFQGSGEAKSLGNTTEFHQVKDEIPASEVQLFTAIHRMADQSSDEQRSLNYKLLKRIIELRDLARKTTEVISDYVKIQEPNRIPPEINEIRTCKHEVSKVFFQECLSVNQINDAAYAVRDLTKLCSIGYSSELIVRSIMKICQ
ncbi:unnamed protein product [Trichobilharzia szidati]|nr:unnamed protein product [Trichobilharzia szidati]